MLAATAWTYPPGIIHAGPNLARRPIRSRTLQRPNGGTDWNAAPLPRRALGCGRHLARSMVELAAGARQPCGRSTSACSRTVDAPVGRVLDALYRRERAGVIAYLRRQVGCEHASDLAQEVFLRAATSGQLLNLRNPSGFLRQIARNLAIDFVRRQRCRIVFMPLGEGSETGCPGEQEDRLLARDTEQRLHRALARLPAKTARVFTMSRFDNKSYRTIQNELGIGLSTVEYHMMKALAHLRAELDHGDCSASEQIISFETKVPRSRCVLP